jgi:hypothetical protein
MVLDEKLCVLDNQGFLVNHFKDYKKLVRHSKFICKDCGRVGRRKRNLCTPKRLYPKDKTGK